MKNKRQEGRGCNRSSCSRKLTLPSPPPSPPCPSPLPPSPFPSFLSAAIEGICFKLPLTRSLLWKATVAVLALLCCTGPPEYQLGGKVSLAPALVTSVSFPRAPPPAVVSWPWLGVLPCPLFSTTGSFFHYSEWRARLPFPFLLGFACTDLGKVLKVTSAPG